MHSSPDTSPLQSSKAEPSDAAVKTDINQMFVLIEGILPFEACLYYQVLPLSIEGSRLNLGMVNLRDQAAADYVRRLVSYINCSIVPRQISSDWHREILSKFLSHSAKSRSPGNVGAATRPTASPSSADTPPLDAVPSQAKTERERPSAPPRSSPTVASPAPKTDVKPVAPSPQPTPRKPFAEQPTLVVNAPDSLLSDEDAEPSQSSPSLSDPSNLSSPPPSAHTSAASAPDAQAAAPNSMTATPTASTPTANVLPSLQHLPPQALTEALLDRVIEEGIGRLYLERQPQFGRILWSKDGVLQSILEQIDLQVFQGVINELKLMVSLSLIPARKPRQVEIERLHRGQPILLRFRLIPGTQGEEATLQVLRGAALKFYQQQQIEKLGRDALGVAQTLQQRLNEIRRQARQSLPSDPVPHESLPAIVEMLKNMEQQVHEMMNAPDP